MQLERGADMREREREREKEISVVVGGGREHRARDENAHR
jgi:uridylate kinase